MTTDNHTEAVAEAVPEEEHGWIDSSGFDEVDTDDDIDEEALDA